MNKKKIINDPVYGFISIPNDLIYDIINHPWFQRLRRIKQLGLTDYVYPGALHTRFHHALGAMHLMKETLDTLREKNVEIDDQEYTAALAAILLHDIGHAPFSHALENSLLPGINHEALSSLIIGELNKQYGGQLNMAIRIFNNTYNRKFFSQLVSSQLDIDRLDYLNRDSYFTGVSEGKIGSERIIKLLNVHNDEMVIEEKGIYSIENFISSRRLMYWQVYFHKTTVAVEKMLIQIIKRAREIDTSKHNISSELKLFLCNSFSVQHVKSDPGILEAFTNLDDYDIIGAIKVWKNSNDFVLSKYCQMLLNRQLLKVDLYEEQTPQSELKKVEKKLLSSGIAREDIKYFIVHGAMSNSAYLGGDHKINVLTKSGKVVDIANAADLPNIKAMRKIVKKYYLCWPKSLIL